MKTPYVSELEPNQLVQGVFLVQHKEVRQKKTGEPYLSLTLADRSGTCRGQKRTPFLKVTGANTQRTESASQLELRSGPARWRG